MKNFTYLLVAGLFSLIAMSANAQPARFNADQQRPPAVVNSPQRWCPTFELMEAAFQADPNARLRYSRTQQMLNETEQQNRENPQARVQAIITVPVVVHVLLPAAQQALVTDAIIQNQLDTLNFFYGGSPFNLDSLRVYEPFRTTYGRSEIRFCLAQRTPSDLPTNGITRTETSTIFNGSNTPGNTIVWDPTKYLNIWVVNGGNSGLLGYSYTPGTWAPNDPHQGFVNDYRAFGSGPGVSSGGYHFNEYNGGKTAVHEIGHYFNLAHTWGPNNSGNPTCTLSDFCADTPPTDGPFFGCPDPGDIPLTNACSPAAPGIMWQNHMDYADDRCMILFTKDQATRMMTAITTAPDRIGLTTSNGCVPPPAAGGDDSRITAIINPAQGSTTACSPITPMVTIQNLGTNPLTSATINVRLDAGLVTQSWTGNLLQGQTANVTLNALAIPTNGSHTLKVHTTLPNGQTDATPDNDTTTVTFTKIAPAALPTSHDFESIFTPTGWSVSNPDGATTWGWYGPGNNSSAGTAMDNYTYNAPGENDDYKTTIISTTGLLANDSILVQWDLAHKNFPGQNDKLQVLVSNNCGASFTTVWEKAGATLATAGSTTGYYTTPAGSDWIRQRASIGQNLFGGGQIQVVFRNVNDFGNVVWLDNINISLKPRKDMQVTAINRPNNTECAPPFAPSITVRNNGGELVTGFKVGYILNGGTPVYQTHNIPLTTGQTATVSFPNLNAAAGSNTIKMFVTDPITASPGPDGTPANDTLVRVFSVPTTVASVIEGFEGAQFIPANWTLRNPNNNLTWAKAPVGKASASSAIMDNWSTNITGQLDIMEAPPVNTANAESVSISFDVAHKNYPGAADRLRVLVSKDCGVTFTAVYSKSGPTLSTGGSMEDDFRNPTQSEWRTESINLDNTYTGGNLIVQFENRSDWGNNIFVDNINIIPGFKRDIQVVNVTPDVLCAGDYSPVATIRNNGTEAVTAFDVTYRVGTGTPVTTNVTGVNLAPGASMNVPLTAGTLGAGLSNIRVYSSAPVTVSGTGDQYLLNDSLSKTATVAGLVDAPIVEAFEGTFLPTGWALANADGQMTWAKAGLGKNSSGSAFLRNFAYYANGQVDALYSPVASYNGADSVILSFDLSATTRTYPGTTTTAMDTLEVLVTRDCGNTFTSVYKKWGAALQTINNSNYPQSTEFSPVSQHLWRTETIDLSSFAPDGPLQVVFRNTSNNQNNVYIDNVNLRTRTLPARLRADGVIVTPNPFTEQFNLWFVEAPTDLRYITVYNSAGQLIWNKTYNGSNTNVIGINLSGKSAGVYVVNVGYDNEGKNTQLRIVKSN